MQPAKALRPRLKQTLFTMQVPWFGLKSLLLVCPHTIGFAKIVLDGVAQVVTHWLDKSWWRVSIFVWLLLLRDRLCRQAESSGITRLLPGNSMGAIIPICSVLCHSLAQGSGAHTTDTSSRQSAGSTDHASGFIETAATHNIAEPAFLIHSIYDIHE